MAPLTPSEPQVGHLFILLSILLSILVLISDPNSASRCLLYKKKKRDQG